MIRKLTAPDKPLILDYCYKNERENLFVLGSFEVYDDTFKENQYWGYFEDDEMKGLAYFATRWGNLIIHASDPEVVKKFVDEAIKSGVKIEGTASFAKSAEPMTKCLKEKYGFKIKKFSEETVYILEKSDFQDLSSGSEEIASSSDIDELVCFGTGKKPNEISHLDRKRINPSNEYILRKDGMIVSKANIHGVSKSYFQIGGVGTRDEYRRKGYAQQVVCFLCKHFFEKGKSHGLLFTGDDNHAAQKLYKGLGFRPVDKFIIAEFKND